MKLLSAQQIHEWDAYTIANEPIDSIDLMERAARRCTDFLIERHFIHRQVKIFCGKGNNGGDGLAIARQLIDAGAFPVVYILEFGAKGTDDFQVNLQRLHELSADIHFLQSKEFFPPINDGDVLIDALFGSGLNRPLKDLSAALVEHINKSNATIVSIDVPSGMFIDKSSMGGNAVIKADYSLTFQSLKLCFLVAENAEYIGEVEVLNIGLLPEFLNTVNGKNLITAKTIAQHYKKRSAFAHKGNFGHALIVAGNKGKMGAAVMAAKACLRTGAGLTTLSIPEAFLNVIHTTIPEAMCQVREEGLQFSNMTVVGIGPGLGTDKVSSALLQQTLEHFAKPLVLDADALTILAHHPEWLTKIPAGSILTPHPKEFERVFGQAENDFERIGHALQLSKKYPFVIVLKGHYSLVASNGEAFFNTTGNPGMAKGGSGDVLTGMITAFLSQGYVPESAAMLGVYFHGLAADIASNYVAEESMIAADIIQHISDAFLTLRENISENYKEEGML